MGVMMMGIILGILVNFHKDLTWCIEANSFLKVGFYACIYLKKHVLSALYVLGIVMGPGDTLNKMEWR